MLVAFSRRAIDKKIPSVLRAFHRNLVLRRYLLEHSKVHSLFPAVDSPKVSECSVTFDSK